MENTEALKFMEDGIQIYLAAKNTLESFENHLKAKLQEIFAQLRKIDGIQIDSGQNPYAKAGQWDKDWTYFYVEANGSILTRNGSLQIQFCWERKSDNVHCGVYFWKCDDLGIYDKIMVAKAHDKFITFPGTPGLASPFEGYEKLSETFLKAAKSLVQAME